ncbi:MAG: hypothetical protein A3C35_08600 [Omnitrophica bacterium RIFCSPHIGHO2_02_FULL_46_11]|nr:MAG: hypothetical protein A3C35_08600 [Omnitrophica bacterium RIFCSPHIGHO2_02_FULL_46_11]
MGKFLLALIVIFALLFIGFYFVSSSLLTHVSYEGLAYLTQNSAKLGVEIADAKFSQVKWNPWRTIVWRNFKGDIKTTQEDSLSAKREFVLSVDEAALQLKSLGDRKFVLTARGLSAVFRRPASNVPGISEDEEDRIDTGHLKIPFQLDFLNPKAGASGLRILMQDLAGLITHGKTGVAVQFSAVSNVMAKGKTFKVRLGIRQEGDQYYLIMDREDIRVIAEELTKGTQERVSEAELDLVSQHPLLAQELLMIQDYAQNMAEQAHRLNPDISEDPYRHVLWSYLLTKAYGPDFAERVTDAHEVGDSKEGEADHKMDYNNNAVGRRYALAGYSEPSLLDRVMSDSDVILSSREV